MNIHSDGWHKTGLQMGVVPSYRTENTCFFLAIRVMVFGKNPGFLAFFNFHGGPNKMAQVNITGSLRATEKIK